MSGRCKQAESQASEAEAGIEALEEEVAALHTALDSERAAAGANLAAAQRDLDRRLSDAQSEAMASGQRDCEALERRLMAQLDEKAEELSHVHGEVAKLQAQLQKLASEADDSAQLRDRHTLLERWVSASCTMQVEGFSQMARVLHMTVLRLDARAQLAAARGMLLRNPAWQCFLYAV